MMETSADSVCCVQCSEVERRRCSSNYSGKIRRLGVGEVGGRSILTMRWQCSSAVVTVA